MILNFSLYPTPHVLRYPDCELQCPSPLSMSFLQKWMTLPAKVRYYVAGLTFVLALVGEYVTIKVNEEAVAQKKILTDLQNEHD